MLIDDVYSGGSREDGDYPLLSEAMAAGLYHPRCRHGLGTYYPEIQDIWDETPENENKNLNNKNEDAIIKENSNRTSKKQTQPLPKTDVDKPSGNAYRKGISDFNPETQKRIHQHEAIIKGNKYETAVVYDQKGDIVFKKKGTKDEVKFTQAEKKKLKGSIITHNHPNNSCFSEDDIKTFRSVNANEIRAVTNGKTYSLKAPEKWSKEALSYDIDAKFAEYELKFADKYRDIAAQTGESLRVLLPKAYEETLQQIAEDIGAKFTIEVK